MSAPPPLPTTPRPPSVAASPEWQEIYEDDETLPASFVPPARDDRTPTSALARKKGAEGAKEACGTDDEDVRPPTPPPSLKSAADAHGRRGASTMRGRTLFCGWSGSGRRGRRAR